MAPLVEQVLYKTIFVRGTCAGAHDVISNFLEVRLGGSHERSLDLYPRTSFRLEPRRALVLQAESAAVN